MTRGFGFFLLAFGVLASVIGGIGTAVAVGELNRGGAGMLVVFLVIDGFGIALILAAAIVLNRAKPSGPVFTGSGEGTDRYPAGKPTTQELDGTPYTTLYTAPVKGKHPRPSELRFETAVATPCEFEMVVETAFDRFCKRLGLAVEVQTGDATFDDACYVRSDTPAFAEEYLGDSLKRTAILDLRRFGFLHLTLKDGKLWAVRTGFDPINDGQPDFDADVAARLVLLARNLPEHRPEFDVRTDAPRKMGQAVLWTLLCGFAATILSLFAFPPVHTTELLVRAAPVLVLGWLSFVYLSAMLLRGTSRSHLAWGRLVLTSVFLFPLGSLGSVGLLNGALDDSPDTTHDAVILEKYTSRSKNTTKYHVRCASWRIGGRAVSYQVSSTDYNAVVAGRSKMVVVTRVGGLGVEWERSHRLTVAP